MPNYEQKNKFEVYNVIGVKDALALLQKISSNNEFNTQKAEDFFIQNGVTVYGLIAPAHKLSDKINEEKVPEKAKEMAKASRKKGRS
ncbi:hypothetical protein [uncultured Jannaschia sp.]|uniref:hypothetical protein n=1 Tax=uncultured Jannaschia sp. TaxID=293347 RepID=UPI0026343487|nr:hypothetical protein [uncultured Jannaschia sp.]